MFRDYKIMKFKKNKNYIKLKNIPKKEEKFTFDIGVAILRPILAFLVIITHCYNINNAKGKWKEIREKTDAFFFHIPTFFIISFYFTYKTLISSNYKKNLKEYKDYLFLIFIGLS